MVTGGLIRYGKHGSNCFVGTYLQIYSVTGLTCTLVGKNLWDRIVFPGQGGSKDKKLAQGHRARKQSKIYFPNFPKESSTTTDTQRSSTLLLQGTF